MALKKKTPMMEQYLSIKKKYPDAILFYRMGDFYEMFLEDAEKAALILEIALTSRNKNQETPIPMCGVPFRAADTYIAKLIENGCKVAVCEQVGDPASTKGLVKRKVVRVITPGMILNEELLDKSSNNFLLALSIANGRAGLACLDISTGKFKATEAEAINGKLTEALIDEALRIAPSEILLPSTFEKDPVYNYIKKPFAGIRITFLGKDAFRLSEAKERLIHQFSTRSLEGFGCGHLSAAISAAGAIIAYVQDTQLSETHHIKTLENYYLNSFLVIDDRSCRNLELLRNIQTSDKKGTLLNVLDKTITAMGGRLLKNWIRYPLLNKKAIESRLNAVEEAALSNLRSKIRLSLKSVHDLERLGSKISMGHGNARDLTAVKNSLLKLPDIFNALQQFKSPLIKGEHIEKKEVIARDLSELAALIDSAIREDAPLLINEGGIIKDGFDKGLDELIEMSRDGKAWIAKKGAEEKKKTGLSSLKIKFNKVFGYFIEVSKVQAASVPDHYIRKQTLVNAERFITEELKEVESKVLTAQEKRAGLEYKIFCKVRADINEKTASILTMADFIATLDVVLGLGEIAEINNYCKPEINEDNRISIREGRHPVVEQMMTNGERYVPNDMEMDNNTNQILIITGPNMAGKSTVLRQVALHVLMAQMGSFVPASSALIPVTDRIFTRVGALDNLSQGQSTFMVEMEETANIVNNATEKSLIILDEIGRGTSTFDGLSIAWAVAEFLHDMNNAGVKTLFATHYHELTRLETIKPRVKNFNIAVKEFNENIIFIRKLVKGGTNKSYGIQVARLAGIPAPIIKRAKEILKKIEADKHLQEHEKKECGRKNDQETGNNNSPRGQMELFNLQAHGGIIEQIEQVDISTMTPIDALNFLNNLKQKLNIESAMNPC